MKKIFYILAIVVCVVNAKPIKAQDRDSYFNLYYSMALGTGDLNDYISAYSWRGVGMQYKVEVYDNVMLGLGADWNVFYKDMGYATYTRSTVAISGDQFRYTNAFPMYGTINYFKDTDGGLRFFGGLGVGTTYIMKELEMNIYQYSKNTWQFLLAPEVGVTYDLRSNSSFLVSVKYNYNFKDKALASQSYLSFNLGFCWAQ